MATKSQHLLLFIFFIIYQYVVTIPSDAAICETPSKLFSGLCFKTRNCDSICEKEGFMNGRCKLLKCICAKDCGTGGGGGGGGGGDPGQGGGGGDPGQGPPEGGDPGQGGEGPPEGGGPGPRNGVAHGGGCRNGIHPSQAPSPGGKKPVPVSY